jgi:hypothetical protein
MIWLGQLFSIAIPKLRRVIYFYIGYLIEASKIRQFRIHQRNPIVLSQRPKSSINTDPLQSLNHPSSLIQSRPPSSRA